MSSTIVWFRNDLRLADNAALAAAIQCREPIIPVFIWSPQEAGEWSPGGAAKWWLHQALKSLAADLAARNIPLIIRTGASLQVLRELIEASGAVRIFWNRRYEGPQRAVDATVKRALREQGIEVQSFNSALLNEPHTVATGGGQPYKVYTPYWKKVKDRAIEAPIEPRLEAMQSPAVWPHSIALEHLELMPQVNWHVGLEAAWEVSEAAAQRRLAGFLKGAVNAYHVDRDRPDYAGTSCLAPYLRWGQIGPRQIVAALRKHCDLSAAGPEVYLKEIYWREFAYHVLYHFPHTPDQPLRAEYADFPWQNDTVMLQAWQQGRTGYPIVDAGMRQLWQTGWMHNRVRMIVSSLLVKHLLQDWQAGARWFWDTLVDADLASNTLGWQWSGGCGADAAPYFRVFNPILQGQKFDPDGSYVKRYVPELQNLPRAYMHEPWQAPRAVIHSSGADAYPSPIIEHQAGRARALAALASFKK